MSLKGKSVVILCEAEYEDLEVHYPRLRLIEEGARVVIAGTGAESYTGKRGYPIKADGKVSDYKAEQFDAVIIPGGWAPDRLRCHESVVQFVRRMHETGKLIAAICHAGSLLVSADIVRGKTVTSYVAVRDDLKAAGAEWVDRSVVVDGRMITSRTPADLPDFCREIIRALS
jgi:protease I